MDSRQVIDNSINEQYSESYDNFQSHELLLRDRLRVTAYYDAIMNNKHLFENKVFSCFICQERYHLNDERWDDEFYELL